MNSEKCLALARVFEEFLLSRDLRDKPVYVYRRAIKVALRDFLSAGFS